MKLVWLVAVGGALGSGCRYLVTVATQNMAGVTFPVGTLVVNVTGSLALGFLMRYSMQSAAISPEMRLLLTSGFCGGYTTFSTFSYESVRLIEDGAWRTASVYMLASVVLSLAAMFVGFRLAQLLRLGGGALS